MNDPRCDLCRFYHGFGGDLPTVVRGDPADRSTWVTMRAGTHGTVMIPTAEPIGTEG